MFGPKKDVWSKIFFEKSVGPKLFFVQNFPLSEKKFWSEIFLGQTKNFDMKKKIPKKIILKKISERKFSRGFSF